MTEFSRSQNDFFNKSKFYYSLEQTYVPKSTAGGKLPYSFQTSFYRIRFHVLKLFIKED